MVSNMIRHAARSLAPRKAPEAVAERRESLTGMLVVDQEDFVRDWLPLRQSISHQARKEEESGLVRSSAGSISCSPYRALPYDKVYKPQTLYVGAPTVSVESLGGRLLHVHVHVREPPHHTAPLPYL